jgi:hypothetical protein
MASMGMQYVIERNRSSLPTCDCHCDGNDGANHGWGHAVLFLGFRRLRIRLQRDKWGETLANTTGQ